MNNLIEAIKETQHKNSLSDSKFAKTLDVDPGYYSKIKRGLVTPGRKFLSALSQKFPELDFAIMQHMKTDTSKEVN